MQQHPPCRRFPAALVPSGELRGWVILLNPPRIPITWPRILDLQRRSEVVYSSRGGPLPFPQCTEVTVHQALCVADILAGVHHDGVDVEAQAMIGFVDDDAILVLEVGRCGEIVSVREVFVVAEVRFDVVVAHQGVLSAGAGEGVVVEAVVDADV